MPKKATALLLTQYLARHFDQTLPAATECRLLNRNGLPFSQDACFYDAQTIVVDTDVSNPLSPGT